MGREGCKRYFAEKEAMSRYFYPGLGQKVAPTSNIGPVFARRRLDMDWTEPERKGLFGLTCQTNRIH